jgi:cytochrome d ubiquinol oxidase subunit I
LASPRLTVPEALHLRTGKQVYRVLFDFWLKIFGIAFGLVSGVVMGFQFGTNWASCRRCRARSGRFCRMRPLPPTEAGFFGISFRPKPSRVRASIVLHAMVALGTRSAF